MFTLLHVCNGLARPADESMLAPNNGTSEHSENIIAVASAAHSLWRHKHIL